MSSAASLPSWLPLANRVIAALQRAGIALFSFQLLAIPGRRSGVMRTTVVSPYTFGGDRYILSFGGCDWVANARHSGWGVLSRGRASGRVTLREIHPPDSAPIVGAFPERIPAGVRFFLRTGLVRSPGGRREFEKAADRLALFRVEEAA